MGRDGIPVIPGVAAARWELLHSPDGQPVELGSNRELLHWAREQAGNGFTLGTVRLRRRYEQDWVSAQQAVTRVAAERGEVIGARAGATVATLLLAPMSLLATGATVVQTIALAGAIAVGGGLAILWRGSQILVRVAIIQAFTVAVVSAREYGILAGAMAGLYAPALLLAFATCCGARLGRAFARPTTWRLRQRLAETQIQPEAERSDPGAVAA